MRSREKTHLLGKAQALAGVADTPGVTRRRERDLKGGMGRVAEEMPARSLSSRSSDWDRHLLETAGETTSGAGAAAHAAEPGALPRGVAPGRTRADLVRPAPPRPPETPRPRHRGAGPTRLFRPRGALR